MHVCKHTHTHTHHKHTRPDTGLQRISEGPLQLPLAAAKGGAEQRHPASHVRDNSVHPDSKRMSETLEPTLLAVLHNLDVSGCVYVETLCVC